jgi:hypothetical protein
MTKKSNGIDTISIEKAKSAARKARKRRSESRAKIPVLRNEKAFNRWLRETYPSAPQTRQESSYRVRRVKRQSEPPNSHGLREAAPLLET